MRSHKEQAGGSPVGSLLNTEGLRVLAFGEVGSTNTIVREAARAGEPEGLLVFASSQTEGRGRRGRSFHSPDGGNLYMSALLRPSVPPSDAVLMTAIAAVAVAEAAESFSGRPCGIKWVNDVYCGGKKVCGILTEAAMDAETGLLDHAVVGIGINVFAPKGGYPEDIASVASALFDAPPDAAVSARLAATVWDRFFRMYRALPDRGFLAQYRARSFLLGRPIDVLRNGARTPATALSVDDDAGLVVRYADGREETLSSGEVSVRAVGNGLENGV